ncbi:MAG TPA: GIDE domain-containing protein [Terriglobales bacterium]|nr:GIDE domain-containing protein [Terriglobales bacterium]
MIQILTFVMYSGRHDGWMWALAGAFAGVYLFYRGFRLLQRKRLILDTPSSKIRSASMGLVEVSGLACGPYTVTAPITGASCYYYRTIAWRWEQRGKNSQWVKVADENLHVPFFLDDNTGRVLVDPQGAELDIHCDFKEEFSSSIFSSSMEAPENVVDFVARHGVSSDHKLKIEEYCIKPKNALFVLGTLATNPGISCSANPLRSESRSGVTSLFSVPLAGLSTSRLNWEQGTNTATTQEVIRLSTDTAPIRAVDMTQQEKLSAAMAKAGIVNPAAWAAAGVLSTTATAVVSSSNGGGTTTQVAPEQFDLHPPVVLMRGTHNPAFFMSWRSQRDVIKALSWKSTLMIWGGPALTVLCVYILLNYFNAL